MAHHEPFVSFDHEDYVSSDLDKCELVIASRRTIAICLSAIRPAHYYNTRWRDGGNRITDNAKLADVHKWVETANGELLMSCEISELLERIAVAVEGIQAKIDSSVEVEISPNGLTPYLDDVEELLQETSRALGGISIPVNGGGE